MSTSRPSRVGAHMLARQDQPTRLGKYLPLIGVVRAGTVIVLIVVAVIVVRHNQADTAQSDYARGATDVSVEALISNPAAYGGSRVHVRGRAGSGTVGETETQTAVSSLTGVGNAPLNREILVIGPEDVAVPSGHEVDVWASSSRAFL